MTLAAIILLPLVYAFADRFAGGGWPRLDDRLPGRAAFWGALAAALVGLFTLGAIGFFLALAWLSWRTPAWRLFPGATMTPRTRSEVIATFGRHLLAPAAVLAVAVVLGESWILTAAAFVSFSGFATLGAWLYGLELDEALADQRPIGNFNHWLELNRGAAFGISAIAAFA